jgi:hypothetical protein
MLTRLHTQGTPHGSKTQIPSSVRTPTPQPPEDKVVVSNKDAVAVIKSNTFMPGANMQKQLDHVSLAPSPLCLSCLPTPLLLAGRRGVLPSGSNGVRLERRLLDGSQLVFRLTCLDVCACPRPCDTRSSCVHHLVSMRTMIAAFLWPQKHGAAAGHMVYIWASTCQWLD